MALTDVVHHAVLTKNSGTLAFITVILSLPAGCGAALESMDVRSITSNLELAVEAFNFTLGCKPQSNFTAAEELALAGRQILKVGLSATLTNTPNQKSAMEIRGLLLGLKLWQVFVENDPDIHFRVVLCVLDDEGNLTNSEEIYELLGADADIDIDVLLGPSNKTFHKAIAKIAHRYDKTILLWAPEEKHYELPWMPDTVSAVMRGYPNPMWGESGTTQFARANQPAVSQLSNANILEYSDAGRRLESEDMQNGSKNQYSETEFLSDMDILNLTAESPARRTYAWNENFGVFDQGYTNVFEVGVNPDRWLFDVFYGLKQDQSSAGVIILDTSSSTNCADHISSVATSAGFDNITLVTLYNPYPLPDLLFRGGWLTLGLTNTWAICGNQLNLFYAMQVLRAMNFMPPSVVFVTPGMIAQVAEQAPIDMLHYVMEPRPIGFLGPTGLYFQYVQGGCSQSQTYDYQSFDSLFWNVVFVDEWPTLSTVLVASAWSALSAALCSTRTRLSQLSVQLRTIVLPSFSGLLSFDEHGRCATCVGGAHQMLPLSQAYPVTANITIYNAFKIVISRFSDFQIPLSSSMAYAYMVVPSPNWKDKELEIFSCDPGCVINATPRDWGGVPAQLRPTYCEACPAGKVRSPWQLQCTECNSYDASLYADERGLSECKVCPTGALCRTGFEDTTPTALPAYYRFQKPGINENSDFCATGFEPEERYMFIHCLSENRCIGGNQCTYGNTGYMCAQCIAGYTYQGPTPNARKCEGCPDNIILALRFYAIFLLYFFMLIVLSSASAGSARDTNNLTVPILLAMLRHFQMLGILFYTMRIEEIAGADFHVYTIPYILGLFLTQPTQLLKLECLWVNSAYPELPDPTGTVTGLFLITIAFACSGFFLIFSQFMISSLCRYLCFIMRAHRVRRRASQVSLNTQKEVSCYVAQRHEMFMKAIRDLHNCERFCLAWSVLVFPMLLMNCCLSVMCESKDLDASRLYVNMDVLCWEGEHQKLVSRSLVVYVLVGFCIPFVLLIPYCQVYTGSAYWHLRVRRSSGLLHSGYKLSYFFFEIFFFLRFALVMVPLWFDDPDLRDSTMCLIQLAFIVFYEANPPRSRNDRYALGILDRFSYSTLFLGQLMVTTLTNPTAQIIMGWSQATSWILEMPDEVVTGACALSFVFFLVALHCLIYNRILLPLHIFKKTGGKLNCFQYVIMKLFTFFHGFHSIRVVSDKNGEDFRLDLGHIFGSERSFLLTTMQETLSACMDSVHQLDMAVIVGAFNESFQRAGKNRDILVSLDLSGGADTKNQLKQTLRNYTNFSFSLGRSRSLSREPSLSTGTKMSIASNASIADMDRGFDLTRHGITVDELYAAFQHVAVDVINHEPYMHQLKADLGDRKKLKHRKETDIQAEQTSRDRTPVDSKQLKPHSDQDREILKRVDRGFSPLGKTFGSSLTWGELEDFLSVKENVSQLEATGLTPYDCMKVFVSLSGTHFLSVGRTGKTGVDHTFVKWYDFQEGCLDRVKLQKRRMREVAEVEQSESRAVTFNRSTHEIHKFYKEETDSMAMERGLEIRCEEALRELTFLRNQLHQKARKEMRCQEVTNQAEAPREGTELYRLLGGSLQTTVGIDKHSVLSKWAKDEHMESKEPHPSSIVSPRARGVEWDKWKDKAIEEGTIDPDKPKRLAGTQPPASPAVQDAQPTSSLPEAQATSQAAQVVNLPTGALGAAAAIMSAAMSRPVPEKVGKPKAKTKAKAAALHHLANKTQELKDDSQDALEFCFDVPREKVHEDVFKAMMLGQFRAHGVSQAAVVGLYMKFLDNAKLTIDVHGPPKAIDELRSRDLLDLKVMGHALRYIEEPSVNHRPANFKQYTQATPNQDVDLRNRLASALSGLRLVDATRHLAKLKEIGSDVDSMVGREAVERVGYIGLRYKECLDMLDPQHFGVIDGWAKDTIGTGLTARAEFGCKVGGPSFGAAGSLFAVLADEYESCDPLRAFTALQELDIAGALLGPLQGDKWEDGKRLGPAIDMTGQSVWHILNEVEELKLKEDNVWRVSAIDALAEPIGCLLVAAHSTAEKRSPLLSGPLPTPKEEEGVARARSEHSVYWCIRPLRAGGEGFRLTVASRLKLNASQYGMLWMMPAWGLTRTVRPLMSNFSTKLRKHLQRGKLQSATPDALQERMASARWSEMLAVLKERFVQVFEDKEKLNEDYEQKHPPAQVQDGSKAEAEASEPPERNVTKPVPEKEESWNTAEAIAKLSLGQE